MPPGLGRFVLYARITSDCVTAPPSSCEKANPSAKFYKYNLLYTKKASRTECEQTVQPQFTVFTKYDVLVVSTDTAGTESN